MTKQEKSALNMAKFIADQTLELHFKLLDLGLDEQAALCEKLHFQARTFYQSLDANCGFGE